MSNYECSICCMRFGNRRRLTDHLVNVYHKQKIGRFGYSDFETDISIV
jgi:hypothetical protein